MTRNFLDLLDLTKSKITSTMYMIQHRTKETYFTRSTAKMQFSEAMYLLLTGLRKTLQIEIDNWFEILGKGVGMTKQSFSELRQKISPSAFIELNDIFNEWFYGGGNFKKYRGYRLLAIDGSITEIPNTENNREHFGYYHNQSEWKQSRAMMSVIYDIENDVIIEADICPWQTAERDAAKELILRASEKGQKNDLCLLDRGYPSKDMFAFLEEQKVKFLIRVKNERFLSKTDNANKPDQAIEILHKDKVLKLRVINVTLDTGENEKLVTNLEESDIDFRELYFKRWGIEVKYCQLKSRYELENFSGNTPIAIEQDFYANIYLSNMMTVAKNESNDSMEAKKQGLKYEYKVNMNILIGKMIPMLIKGLCEEDGEKRGELYHKTILEITKNLVPIRPGRHFPRKEPSRKNKYPYTRKRAL